VEATFMREARDAGASITHIAEALGTTRQTVHNRLQRLAQEQREREAPRPSSSRTSSPSRRLTSVRAYTSRPMEISSCSPRSAAPTTRATRSAGATRRSGG